MKTWQWWRRSILSGLVLGTVAAADMVWSTDVPRMTKEALKARLGDPELLLFDLRRGRDWIDSDHKIEGAIRQEDKPYLAWAIQYPKDRTLVLYCA